MTNNKKHLYIIGAGFAGQTIADDIKRIQPIQALR